MSVLSLLGISQSQRQQSLNSVQAKAETQLPNISMYDLSQLEDMIQFGRTHLRKTFNQMWLEERRWIIWFAQRYTTWNELSSFSWSGSAILRCSRGRELESYFRKQTNAPITKGQGQRRRAKQAHRDIVRRHQPSIWTRSTRNGRRWKDWSKFRILDLPGYATLYHSRGFSQRWWQQRQIWSAQLV